MKTAEEYLDAILNSANTAEKDAELIKAYGKQCAEQALKDAAENAEMIDDGTSNYDAKTICKESILSTPIITP